LNDEDSQNLSKNTSNRLSYNSFNNDESSEFSQAQCVNGFDNNCYVDDEEPHRILNSIFLKDSDGNLHELVLLKFNVKFSETESNANISTANQSEYVNDFNSQKINEDEELRSNVKSNSYTCSLVSNDSINLRDDAQLIKKRKVVRFV
jgi:hypothetical protein